MEELGKRRLTMGKGERLRHKTLVDGLFHDGKTLYDYPLRVTYRVLGADELEKSFRDRVPDKIGLLQMMITIPKKKLRHAVDRVRMRRVIREAYRLHRLDLRDIAQASCVRNVSMAFIYLQSEKADYSVIEKKMKKLLSKIGEAVRRKETKE